MTKSPRHHWFTATSSAEQAAALAQLAEQACSWEPEESKPARAAQCSLIELLQMSLHPRERVPIIQALGRCARVVVRLC